MPGVQNSWRLHDRRSVVGRVRVKHLLFDSTSLCFAKHVADGRPLTTPILNLVSGRLSVSCGVNQKHCEVLTPRLLQDPPLSVDVLLDETDPPTPGVPLGNDWGGRDG